MTENDILLSEEFVKAGCPSHLRGRLWKQVLQSSVGDKVNQYRPYLSCNSNKRRVKISLEFHQQQITRQQHEGKVVLSSQTAGRNPNGILDGQNHYEGIIS